MCRKRALSYTGARKFRVSPLSRLDIRGRKPRLHLHSVISSKHRRHAVSDRVGFIYREELQSLRGHIEAP